jgi:1-hydroxycarotenoid 3,4-desaturase
MAEATVSSLRDHRVVVVGAGVAGLVSALLLAARGLQVTLVEKEAAPGGKMRQIAVGGSGGGIDSGPTVFTMRWVFDQIFESVGTCLTDHLRLQPLGVLARHAWDADQRLDLFADAARSAEAIGEFAGPAEAQRFIGFCDQARRVYQTLEGPVIRSQRPSLLGMGRDLGPSGLGVLAGLGPFATLWRSLSKHFSDPRLQQLFGRYATYCGSSPFAAPATLMLVAQVEMDGVWAVDGGMHAVARTLAALAAERGALIRYQQPCAEVLVEAGRAVGVLLASGERIDADTVVFNGDASALATGLLGDAARTAAPATKPSARSLSAMTWSLRARTSGFPLVRHNVFFNSDYASEFSDIFGRGRLPREGTVYVCAQDRDDGGLPPAGDPARAERLLCLVNAPANGDGVPLSSSEIDRCEQTHFGLMQRMGLTIHRTPENSVLTTPGEFHRLFPATGGALYGPASHGWMGVFQRPSSRSRIPGLLLAGGSVHPGPGVPMAAMSGRLAAETLMAHLDSTSRSRRAPTSGGTSTPSATTAATP